VNDEILEKWAEVLIRWIRGGEGDEPRIDATTVAAWPTVDRCLPKTTVKDYPAQYRRYVRMRMGVELVLPVSTVYLLKLARCPRAVLWLQAFYGPELNIEDIKVPPDLSARALLGLIDQHSRPGAMFYVAGLPVPLAVGLGQGILRPLGMVVPGNGGLCGLWQACYYGQLAHVWSISSDGSGVRGPDEPLFPLKMP
jgi:hypothetical protein